jgi:hypothetical protein
MDTVFLLVIESLHVGTCIVFFFHCCILYIWYGTQSVCSQVLLTYVQYACYIKM